MRNKWSGIGLISAAVICMHTVQARADDSLSDAFDLLDRRSTSFQSNAQNALPNSIRKATDVLRVQYLGSYRGPYLDLANEMAQSYGLPQGLFARLIQQESGWNPNAVSPKGALGLGQLMPATARGLGVDPRDPRQNLDGAARYLRRQYDDFRDWRLALAAYNAGPEAVRRYNGIPPYSETQNYVLAILGE